MEKQPVLLRISLMFLLGINGVNSWLYAFHKDVVVKGLNSEKAEIAVTMLLVLSLINILSVISIFYWRKIGLFILTTGSFLMAIIDHELGIPFSASVWPLLFVGAVYGSFYVSGTWGKLR